MKKSARGEADEILTVYAKDFGKLKVLGKAIKKITSKLRGGADLFYLSEIEFIQGKTRKTLTDAILIENFKNIRRDLLRLKIAYRIAELLDDLISKEEKDGKIWELVNEVLEKLNNPKLLVADCRLLYYYFFWHLVSILGYQPKISGCSIQAKEVNCDIIKILKVILEKDWRILSRLRLEPGHLRLFKNISEWYNDNVVSIKIHEPR